MKVRFNFWKGSSGEEWLYGGSSNFLQPCLVLKAKRNTYVMWVAAGTENPLHARSELCSRAGARSYITAYRSSLSWRVRTSCWLPFLARMRTIGVSIKFDMIHEKSMDRENNRLSKLQDGEMFMAQ